MTALRIIDNHLELANIGSNTHAQLDNHLTLNPNGTADGQLRVWNGSLWSPIDAAQLKWHAVDRKLIIGNSNFNGDTLNCGNDLTIVPSGADATLFLTGTLDVSSHAECGSLDVNGLVRVTGKLEHAGDSNTYIEFTTDQIDFRAGGYCMLRLDEAAQDVVTVNPYKANIDFRVYGDTKTLLYADAGGEYVQFGGGFGYHHVRVTADYQALMSDHVIICDTNNFTVTLPKVALDNQELIIKNIGAAAISVDGNGAETIDGAAHLTLGLWEFMVIIASKDQGGWLVIGSNF